MVKDKGESMQCNLLKKNILFLTEKFFYKWNSVSVYLNLVFDLRLKAMNEFHSFEQEKSFNISSSEKQNQY